MSWDGTVRCSHCWEKGHNKRSCPKLKERLSELAEDGDLYAQRKLRESQTRKCSFCGHSYHKDDPHKHNASTCGWRKKFEAEVLNEVLAHRFEVEDAMNKIGFTPGALVSMSVQEWDHEQGNYNVSEKYLLLKDLNWLTVTPQNVSEFGYVEPIVANYYDPSGKTFSGNVPREVMDAVNAQHLESIKASEYNRSVYKRNTKGSTLVSVHDGDVKIPNEFRLRTKVKNEQWLRDEVKARGERHGQWNMDRTGPLEE